MKTAKPFSKAAETRLLGAAKEMTAHVEENGMLPDEAIAKVASEQGLPREWLPLLVQAHNHGRATYQRERTGPDLLEKLSEFPLASVEGVTAIMYPRDIDAPAVQAEKTAVSAEYAKEPKWAGDFYKAADRKRIYSVPMEKAAAAAPLQRDPDAVMTSKFQVVSKLAMALNQARQDTRQAKLAYLSAMGTLADYFKGDNARSFSKHAYWAEQLFGDIAKHAMAYVRTRNHMKVAEVAPPAPDGQPITSDREPYNLVKAAIDAGIAMVETRKKEAQAKVKHAEAHDGLFRPFVPALTEAPSLLSGNQSLSSKEAGGMFGGILGGLGVGMAKNLQPPAPPTPGQMSSSMVDDLSDPDHEQQLQQIQVRSMLSDMLANDEVISGYDPDEVMTAYNEIASLSPRASSQPAVMRPLLRKRLTAGSVEPFEAQQMADIEKTIKQTEAPISPVKEGVLHGNPILNS